MPPAAPNANPLSWNPLQFEQVVDGPFDTSMGTAKVKTNAGEGFLKAMGNRQGPHALACELVGSALARWFRLPVPEFAILTLEEVDCYSLPRGARTAPGPAFISRAVSGRTWDTTAEDLSRVENPKDITRLVVFDTWVRNCDRHPPDLATRKPNYANVFLADTERPDRSRLLAIDHTHCFDCGRDLTPQMANIDKVRDDRVYGLFPAFVPHIDPEELARCAIMLQGMERNDARALVELAPPEWMFRNQGDPLSRNSSSAGRGTSPVR